MFLLLYADDITIFSETPEGLQKGLNLLREYNQKWKSTVNTEKTKVILFSKRWYFTKTIKVLLWNHVITNSFIIFLFRCSLYSWGSFSNAQNTLSGQAQAALFKLNSYLYDFVDITKKHTLELFDKVVGPILNYRVDVWGFCKANQIERVHMQFCKRLLGVKKIDSE